MLTDEEQLVQDSIRRADSTERSELRTRSFSREAAIAALVLCTLGLVCLTVCVIGGFDLRAGSADDFEVTHLGGHSYALSRPTYDLTTLFAGMGTAGFAAALIICGGVAGHLKRMPPGSVYAVGMSAVVSTVGLLVLAFVA